MKHPIGITQDPSQTIVGETYHLISEGGYYSTSLTVNGENDTAITVDAYNLYPKFPHEEGHFADAILRSHGRDFMLRTRSILVPEKRMYHDLGEEEAFQILLESDELTLIETWIKEYYGFNRP